jgi:hypothetical protein
MPTNKKIGRSNGKVIAQKLCQRPAPSIAAASCHAVLLKKMPVSV